MRIGIIINQSEVQRCIAELSLGFVGGGVSIFDHVDAQRNAGSILELFVLSDCFGIFTRSKQLFCICIFV